MPEEVPQPIPDNSPPLPENPNEGLQSAMYGKNGRR